MFDLLGRTKINLYGLIVLDLNMPAIDGFETLKKLKDHSEYKHIPVIIYTTSRNEAEKERCIQAGAIDYISKPDSYQGHIAVCSMLSFMLKLSGR